MKKRSIHIHDMLDAIRAIDAMPADKRDDYYHFRAVERDLAIGRILEELADE